LIREACAENVRLIESVAGKAHSLIDEKDTLPSTKDRLAEDQTEAKLVSKTDPLTSLLNRRGFEDLAALVVDAARKSGRSLALAMFDLDHFKELNDTLGHDCGDALLVAVAERIKATVRANDAVCRWGGDKIALLICGLDEEECISMVNRIQQAVQGDPLTCGDVAVPMSMTAGLCWIPEVANDFRLEQALQEADESLHEARSSQRGTLVCRGYARLSGGQSAPPAPDTSLTS
jgi:diguanylate cyclase (GGDEF)-like protein